MANRWNREISVSYTHLDVYKRQVVRRLAAIENFGSMNVLCMDKTGTITKGTVELEGAYDADGKPSDLVFKEAYTLSLIHI